MAKSTWTTSQTYEHDGREYNVAKLWELAKGLPSKYLSTDAPDVQDYLKAETWNGPKNPAQVLEDRDNSHGHMDRIQSADLRHAIILAPNYGVADGLHRMAKAVDKKKEVLRFKRFETWEEMEPALIKKGSSNGIRMSKEATLDDNDKLDKKAVLAPQRQAELEAWQRWSQDRNPQDFKFLLDSYRPLMYSAGRRYLQTAKVPRSAVEADMIQHFHRALETYNPDKGAQINTHVWHHLQHTGRFLRTYTNIGKIPEPRARKIGAFEERSSILEDMYGRPPTTTELSDDLGIEPQDIELLRKEIRKDIILEQKTEGVAEIAPTSPRAMEQLTFLHQELAPEQQNILERTYGMYGHQSVDNNEELARILGMTPQKVRSIKRQIARKYEKRFV